MKKLLLALLGLALLAWLLALGPLSRSAAAARLLTLQEAVRLALEHDPETKNAKRSIQIAETKRSQARRRYLPKLDVGLTNSPQVDYYGQPVINKMLWNSFVAMDQPLYAGGTIRNSVKLAESEIRRQGYEYAIYYQRTTTEATRAYFQTLGTQGTVDQYEALQKQSEEEVREAETRFKSGLLSRFDLLEAANRLLDTQQKLSRARADHQAATASLRKILGLEGDEYLRLVDEMPIADITPEFDLLVGEAMTKRPELLYVTEDVKYNQLRTDIERGKQKPQFSLVAAHEWQSPQVFESNKNFYIMLKASYSWENTTHSYQESRQQIYPNAYAFPRYPGSPPLATYYFSVRTLKYSLFDNSSNKVELEKARSDRELAHDRWRQEQLGLSAELKAVLAQKQESAGRIDLAKKQIGMSEEMVAISRQKYRTGLATVADVLKARAALAEANINLINARKDFAIALVQLHRILGRNLFPLESSP